MIDLPLKDHYKWMLWVGVLFVIVPGLLRTYFMMPFPGSQNMETMNIAYFLDKYLLYSRIIGLLLIVLPVINIYLNGTLKGRIWISILVIGCVGIFYFMHSFHAEKIFEEPKEKIFATSAANKVPLDKLVIGIEINGQTKAYPIQYIGYHHKVQDSVGGKPLLITYCTMCRSGRVFDPIIDGVYQTFRLVGARHFNAVIEDKETGSWWYQATGVAAIGPQEGKAMTEITSEQMTLRQWIELHPSTLIMQQDQNYLERYAELESYDQRQTTNTDPANAIAGWQRGAWVVGVVIGDTAVAYRWNEIAKLRTINTAINSTPLVIAIGSDSSSFGCWKRTVDGAVLNFSMDSGQNTFHDESGSLWNMSGVCIEGTFKGKKLERILAYQEYWHSWKTFHPNTKQWKS
jgi:hypothetical protein